MDQQPFFVPDTVFLDQQEQAAKKRRNATIVGVIIGLLVLAGIGTLIWYFATRSSSSTPTPSTTKELTKDQLREKAKEKKPASGIVANCASASDCDTCKDGYGPNLEQYGDMVRKGLPDSEIPPLCTVKQDWLYRQTVQRRGTKFESDNIAGPAACKAEFGAQSQFVGEPIVAPFRQKAGLKEDVAVPFAQFSDQMNARSDAPADSTGSGSRFFTCREMGFLPTISCPAEKANFQPPDCASKCIEGYGPTPGSGVADPCSKSGYVKGFEYRLHGECYDSDWLAKNKPCGNGEEFVELVPQAHATGLLLGKYKPYSALYALINSNSPSSVAPCANGMQSAICRRPAWILPQDQETKEQEAIRLAKPFENRLKEKEEDAKRVADAFKNAPDSYTNQLKTLLQARVLIDQQTGESKGGYFADMIPLYEQSNPNVPLPTLAADAQKSFAALSSAAKQKVALDFVGKEGSLNADQANEICAKRKLLSDYRDAISAYLASSFNEFQSWPPKTIPNVFVNKYNAATGNYDVSLICK